MRIIALGFSCNNACIYCAQGKLRANDPAPSAIDDQIAQTLPNETVAFVGGEPTLFDRLPDWIRAVHDKQAGRVLVQTNGRRLAYRSFARLLREASHSLTLDVALPGSTEAMHDYHTGANGSFRQTILGLRHAHAERIQAGVSIVVTRSNYRHLSEIVAVAHAVGVSAVHFSMAQPFGNAAQAADRILPPPELVRPYLSRAIAEAERLRMGHRVGERLSSPELRERFAGMGEVEPLSFPRPTDGLAQVYTEVLQRRATGGAEVVLR